MSRNLQEEYIDPQSGYSVDIKFADRRVIMEVDGPTHYSLGSHNPLGHTQVKRRHLAALGYTLFTVPYWRWFYGLSRCVRTRMRACKYPFCILALSLSSCISCLLVSFFWSEFCSVCLFMCVCVCACVCILVCARMRVFLGKEKESHAHARTQMKHMCTVIKKRTAHSQRAQK